MRLLSDRKAALHSEGCNFVSWHTSAFAPHGILQNRFVCETLSFLSTLQMLSSRLSLPHMTGVLYKLQRVGDNKSCSLEILQ